MGVSHRKNPIGHTFTFARDQEPIQIVGVVRASKYARVDEPARRVVYTCILQDPNPSSLVVYMRTATAPKLMFATVRREATFGQPANGNEITTRSGSSVPPAGFPFEAGCLHRKEHRAIYSHYQIKSGLERGVREENRALKAALEALRHSEQLLASELS